MEDESLLISIPRQVNPLLKLSLLFCMHEENLKKMPIKYLDDYMELELQW
jgi:hypothetical protein